MSQDEVKKVKLKVKCRAISVAELTFDENDKFFESGSYGNVRRAQFEEKTVAVKYFLSAEQKRGYNQELTFLTLLQKHDNIVLLHGTGMKQKQPFIVMEFAPYSLERVLHGPSPRYAYNAGHVLHWSRQLAIGLEYIHNKRILHRDIKASNLLLFGNGSHLKLCDFGTCRNLETNLLYTGSVGTVRYMAPEVIKGEAYTQKCDIFSFAITLWEMLARKVPTVSASEQHNTYSILFQMAEGKRPPKIVNLPPVIGELIDKCWHQDHTVRMTSASLVKKLTALSSYFQYGNPLTIESKDDGDDVNGTSEDDTTIKASLNEEHKEQITVAPFDQDVPSSPPIHRTQSDLSQVKAYLEEMELKKLHSYGTKKQPHPQSHLQPQLSIPHIGQHDHSMVKDLSHGYPPHDSYPAPKNINTDDSVDLVMRKNSIGDSEVHVDHEVQEVIDPHSDDKRYVSMDENMLRFDVQRQYRQLEQVYQTALTSSASLPGNISRSSINRRSAPVINKPDKATIDSPYAIPGLPPDLQPVIPNENDPESLRIYEQYKKLSIHFHHK